MGPPGGTQPGNSATTPPPSPLDSIYFTNLARNQFDTNNQIRTLNQQGGYASTNLQNALANLAYQAPRQELQAEQAANNRGALFSTVYDQQLGNLARGFQQQGTDLTENAARADAARAAQIKAIEGSIPLYKASQYAAAVERASLAAQQNKALGEPPLPKPKPPPKPPKPPKTKPPKPPKTKGPKPPKTKHPKPPKGKGHKPRPLPTGGGGIGPAKKGGKHPASHRLAKKVAGHKPSKPSSGGAGY